MLQSIVLNMAGKCTHTDPQLLYEWNRVPRPQIICAQTRIAESLSEATHTKLSRVRESFASKNTCVTADVKQRIGLRFVLNIADTNHLCQFAMFLLLET